jgi:translation initiation factor 1 (eIF-1/SUI1)
VTEVLSVVFNDILTKRTEKIEQEIHEIKEQNISRDREINEIKKSVDKYEQNERTNNAIISGLDEADMTTEKVMTRLNQDLGCNIKERDLLYTVKLTGNKSQPSKVRVVFARKSKKTEIFKAKKKLKGTNNTMWITDDLTPMRTNLAFLARQAVRESKLKKTWVHNGKVFAIKGDEEGPFRISKVEDLPN